MYSHNQDTKNLQKISANDTDVHHICTIIGQIQTVIYGWIFFTFDHLQDQDNEPRELCHFQNHSRQRVEHHAANDQNGMCVGRLNSRCFSK